MLDVFDIDDIPVALEPSRCEAMAKVLKKQPDPEGGVLSVQRVWASFDPDERGLIEVLFTSLEGPTFVNGVRQPAEALTAYMRGQELAYVVEGW